MKETRSVEDQFGLADRWGRKKTVEGCPHHGPLFRRRNSSSELPSYWASPSGGNIKIAVDDQPMGFDSLDQLTNRYLRIDGRLRSNQPQSVNPLSAALTIGGGRTRLIGGSSRLLSFSLS